MTKSKVRKGVHSASYFPFDAKTLQVFYSACTYLYQCREWKKACASLTNFIVRRRGRRPTRRTMCDPRVREWELVISPPGSADTQRGERERDGPSVGIGLGHTAAPQPPRLFLPGWLLLGCRVLFWNRNFVINFFAIHVCLVF